MGITVDYPPELLMHRIADMTLGSAKTDAKEAAVIVGAARTMPHTLRIIKSTSDEDAAALSMLTDFDLDFASQLIDPWRGTSLKASIIGLSAPFFCRSSPDCVPPPSTKLLCLWAWVTVLCQDFGDTSVCPGGDTCGLRLSGELR